MLTINLQDSLICVYLTPLIHEPAFVWKEIKYDALAKCRHDAFILTISTDYISQIDRIKDTESTRTFNQRRYYL